MSLSSNSSEHLLNTRVLLVGAVLTAIGGMLAAFGLSVGAAAVINAARRWQQRTEMTPAELAKHAYDAAQTARAAGAGAWRSSTPAGPLRSSSDGARTAVS